MIQPLRAHHRWTFEVLGVLLPVIFLAGLAARPPATKELMASCHAPGQQIWEDTHAWKNRAITTTLYSQGPAVLVQLAPASELNESDLLLYWSPETAPPANIATAKLLGTFDPNRHYQLPQGKHGSLLLYSAAHAQVIDSATLDSQP